MQAWPATLLKKETLAQVFSCEFCEISKNTFFTEHLRAKVVQILYLSHDLILELLKSFLFSFYGKSMLLDIQTKSFNAYGNSKLTDTEAATQRCSYKKMF